MAVTERRSGPPGVPPGIVDAALSRGDVPAALSAWQAAYGAARGSRRWEGFAEVTVVARRTARRLAAPERQRR